MALVKGWRLGEVCSVVADCGRWAGLGDVVVRACSDLAARLIVLWTLIEPRALLGAKVLGWVSVGTG